ncbi:MAG: efflux RND transporter periplasmic adaptor subunit [Bacteroidales bacterium]|nr:efflux RND transporter periplasmic adaptor subunit [Bacteroidales bacterium]
MKKGKIIIGVIILLGVLGFITFKVLKKSDKELVIRTYVVDDYTIENTVTATGTIQPLEQVEVGTQVSGEIDKIFVDYNSVVKKGQLLAELDKSNLLENLRQAEASVRSAESELEYSKTSFERTKQLYEAKAATQIAYDESRNSLVKAETSLQNAQSNLDKAKVNLGYAEIYSPIDGVVLSREVEVGQTVAASYSTPTLFTIANDLTQMKVEANIDEADIGQVVVGQRVTFSVDAYVDDTFYGEVQQIRLQPTTTNNVVTYTVIITAHNPELKLLPGMTASVTIITEEETGLAVPSEALSFTPSEEVMKEMAAQFEGDFPKPQSKGKRPDFPQGMSPQGMPGGPRPDFNGGGFPGERPNFKEMEMVWVKVDGKMMPRPIKTGMSDGVYRIVEHGLMQGDSVVLSANYVDVKANANMQKMGNNPFMPGPPPGVGKSANPSNNGRTTPKR